MFQLKNSQKLLVVLVFGLVSFIFIAAAFAHSTVLWAEVIDGKVSVEAFFGNGNKIKNTPVIVIDKNGKKMLEGKTDEQGKWVFDPPVKGDMIIILKVSEGHETEFKIKADDFKPAEKTSKEQTKEKEKK